MTSVTKEIILMSPLVIALTLLTLLTLILTTKRGFLLDIFECGIVCYFPFYWNPIDYSLFQRRFSENKAIFSSSQKADRAWKFKIDWKRIHNARYTASKKSYIGILLVFRLLFFRGDVFRNWTMKSCQRWISFLRDQDWLSPNVGYLSCPPHPHPPQHPLLLHY